MKIEDNIIEEILQGIFLKEGITTSEISENDELNKLGLNSISAIELVVELERKFNIIIEAEDLIMENYNSIKSIKKLLNKYSKH